MARRSTQLPGRSWNPLTGCSKISPGCAHCYAERFALRLQEIGVPKYANGFALTLHEDVLEKPFQWIRPYSVFVNSMGDLFHKDVPDEFILRVFDVMRRANWHRYSILTKRSQRMLELSAQLPLGPHIAFGVTLENQDYTYRIDHLQQTDAKPKFLSVEPLLGPLRNLNLEGIDSVMVGGESGPGARPMDPAWVAEIQDQCAAAGVEFHLKQWGGVRRNEVEGGMLDVSPETSEAETLSLFPDLTAER